VAKDDQSDPTLSRLLRIKHPVDRPELPSEPDRHNEQAGKACINCGYLQQGQSVDRCPECGLLWASRICDPMSWSTAPASMLNWWQGAVKVWTWDRRIRVRTSFIPTTPQSRHFAAWSSVLAAIPFGTAFAMLNGMPTRLDLSAIVYFLSHVLLSIVLVGVLLAVTIRLSTLALRGIWRRGLQIVPASVHYSTAWWPLLAAIALLAQCAHAVRPASDVPVLIAALAAVGWLMWAFWLWASVTESQHVRYVAGRIAAAAMVAVLFGVGSLWLLPRAMRATVATILSGADQGLARVKLLGTLSAGASKSGSQTYALLMDVIPTEQARRIRVCMNRLGADSGNRVAIKGDECTLENIEAILKVIRADLKPEDKFVLYIRALGSEEKELSFQVADAVLSTEQLQTFLTSLPTSRCLVLIDSDVGTEIVSSLFGKCNAVLVDITGGANIPSRSDRPSIWEAWLEQESDYDEDGQVTVEEVYWRVFDEAMEQRDEDRRTLYQPSTQDDEQSGDQEDIFPASLRLEISGRAKTEDFAVTLPPKPDTPQQDSDDPPTSQESEDDS
jgi:hypothetical protein